MNTGQDITNPRFPKPLDTVITALGIALFVVFTAVGVNQASDKQAVTGNNQRQSQSAQDEELFITGSESYIGTAISSMTAELDDTEIPKSEKSKENKANDSSDRRGENSSEQKIYRQDTIENRSRVE